MCCQNKQAMETNAFLYKRRKVSYRSQGKGPLVVLLHGFGEDGTIWQNQYNLFPSHQLVIPDLPGTGESELLDDMSMEGMAEAIYALIASPNPSREGLSAAQPWLEQGAAKNTISPTSEGGAVDFSPLGELEGALLIGHSMGGYIALALAEKYPGALNGLGLFHSTAFADSEEKKETRRKGIETIRQKGATAFLETMVPNLYGPTTKSERPALIAAQLASVQGASEDALVAYYEAMMQRPDRTAVLVNSKVPVLFVMGEHDTAVPLADALKQSHLPAIAHVELLQTAGHMGMVEEVEKANKSLNAFVAAVTNTV